MARETNRFSMVQKKSAASDFCGMAVATKRLRHERIACGGAAELFSGSYEGRGAAIAPRQSHLRQRLNLSHEQFLILRASGRVAGAAELGSASEWFDMRCARNYRLALSAKVQL
jgi:hypothetical protein